MAKKKQCQLMAFLPHLGRFFQLNIFILSQDQDENSDTF